MFLNVSNRGALRRPCSISQRSNLLRLLTHPTIGSAQRAYFELAWGARRFPRRAVVR
jgi:hypothetical protein